MAGRNTTGDNGLTLYIGAGCPYCWRVTNAMEAMGVRLPIKDVWADPAARDELIAGGGRTMVPCLRIESPAGEARWMYESLDIIDYLQQRFG